MSPGQSTPRLSTGSEEPAPELTAPRASAVETVVPNYIDVKVALGTKVVRFPKLLGDADLEAVLRVHQAALRAGDPMETNPQNRQHKQKVCTFLHGATAPNGGLLGQAPHVLAKMMRAAISAKETTPGWGAMPSDEGPLADIDLRRLSIRVVELWEYEPGGGLVDDFHYDAGSIVTIVCQVSESEDFTGGVFRTFEAGGVHEEYLLERGDVICFISHKYHNITPVLTGRRRSLVVELWQGGLPMWCR